MMLLKKPWFLLVLSFGWGWFCLHWFCCWMQVACPNCSADLQNPFAIGFLLNEAQPDFGPGHELLLNQLDGEDHHQHQMEVTGKYFLNESQGAELGLLRAMEVSKLLVEKFELTMAPKIRTQKIWEEAQEGEDYFEAIDLQWIEVARATPTLALERSFFFEEANSDQVLTAADTEYLSRLVQELQQDSRAVLITGHTDNLGDEAVNERIGRRRARFIAKELQRLGLSAERMVLENKADSQPLVPNDTDENRAKNRRVELKVIP